MRQITMIDQNDLSNFRLYHCFHVFIESGRAYYLDHSQSTWNEYRGRFGDWYTFPISLLDEAMKYSALSFLQIKGKLPKDIS